jgi:hypothetical protein
LSTAALTQFGSFGQASTTLAKSGSSKTAPDFAALGKGVFPKSLTGIVDMSTGSSPARGTSLIPSHFAAINSNLLPSQGIMISTFFGLPAHNPLTSHHVLHALSLVCANPVQTGDKPAPSVPVLAEPGFPFAGLLKGSERHQLPSPNRGFVPGGK